MAKWKKGMVVRSSGGTVKKPLKIGSIKKTKDLWGRPLTEYQMLVQRNGKWVYTATVTQDWLDGWADPVEEKSKKVKPVAKTKKRTTKKTGGAAGVRRASKAWKKLSPATRKKKNWTTFAKPYMQGKK